MCTDDQRGGDAPRVLRAGDRALLVETENPALAAAQLRALDGVLDVVPAACTVLVALADGADAAATSAAVARALAATVVRSDGDPAVPTPVVEIPVRYDGPDLADAARAARRGVAEFVALHSGVEWCCAFVGFAPGFGYLESDAWPYSIPRRATSRTAVPPGAVAVADGFSAVYPRRSPGGWLLIGTTDAVLWDIERTPPNLVAPGTRVRFVDVTGRT